MGWEFMIVGFEMYRWVYWDIYPEKEIIMLRGQCMFSISNLELGNSDHVESTTWVVRFRMMLLFTYTLELHTWFRIRILLL